VAAAGDGVARRRHAQLLPGPPGRSVSCDSTEYIALGHSGAVMIVMIDSELCSANVMTACSISCMLNYFLDHLAGLPTVSAIHCVF